MDLHGARGGNHHRAEWVVPLQGCVTIVVLAAARSRSAAIVAASARAVPGTSRAGSRGTGTATAALLPVNCLVLRARSRLPYGCTLLSMRLTQDSLQSALREVGRCGVCPQARLWLGPGGRSQP